MITEAAAQPSDFTATFTYKIDAIRTATVGDKTCVVKQVEWTLTGKESGQTFHLPQTTILNDPSGTTFIELANLSEEEIATWVEATETRLPGIKAHIQYVINKQIASKSLTATPLPWLPVIEQTITPPTV